MEDDLITARVNITNGVFPSGTSVATAAYDGTNPRKKPPKQPKKSPATVSVASTRSVRSKASKASTKKAAPKRKPANQEEEQRGVI